ncbi:MAG: isoprenylcysteine carboxylmethyltransferase family protein [Candidatus Nanopelagicales bacterium]
MAPLVRRLLQLLVSFLVQGAALFVPAGTLAWPAAWTYLLVYLLLVLVGAAVLLPLRSGVVAERARGRAGAVHWDLVITRLYTITTLAVLVVAGLAVRREWRPEFPLWLRAVGVAMLVGGYALTLWAMAANRFFAQVVRIQTERGHVVVTDGPYRIVRHPGYAGMMVAAAGSVLLLGTPWAGLPYGLTIGLVLMRTSMEDHLLAEELPGYAQYAQRTRYRLLPGVW